MSALIKSGAQGVTRVATLGTPPRPARERARAPDPRDAEIARLHAEIERLTDLADDGARAETAARDAGRSEGRAEAVEREEDRLDILRHGMADACERFEARLALIEELAPQLARAALEKLFEPAEHWAAMAEAAISRQLLTLRRSATVAIAVSPADFDPARAAAICGGQVQVALDPDLRAGAARIECTLGQVELDVREQGGAILALLDSMAGDAA